LRSLWQKAALTTHFPKKKKRLLAGDQLIFNAPSEQPQRANDAIRSQGGNRDLASPPIIAANVEIADDRKSEALRLAISQTMIGQKPKEQIGVDHVIVHEVQLAGISNFEHSRRTRGPAFA
jgi:hypothetical protein